MKYKILTASLALLFVLAVAPAYGEEEGEVYYCSDNAGVGFQFDEKKGSYQKMGWQTYRFKMKLDLPNKRIELAFENHKDLLNCTQPYDSILSLLSCHRHFNMFNFNPDTGRYVYATGFGYVNGDNDSVKVTIGKCDKF